MLLSIRVDFVGHSKIKRSLYRVISGLALICALFAVFLYSRHDIGIAAAKLETDIRGTSKIQADWTVDGSVSNTMAAYIAYPQERTDHSFESSRTFLWLFLSRRGKPFECR